MSKKTFIPEENLVGKSHIRSYARERVEAREQPNIIARLKVSIQRNPTFTRGMIYMFAMALACFSAMGLVLIFQVLFQPGVFLLNLSNFLFAIMMITMELSPEDFPDATEYLFTNFGFLKTKNGRALFLLYIGSTLWAVSDSFSHSVGGVTWEWIYMLLAIAFMALGAQIFFFSMCPCDDSTAEDGYGREDERNEA